MLRFSWRCYPSCALSCSLCAADCVLAPADFSLAADFCLRKPRTSSEPNLSFNTTLRNLGQTQSKTSINQPQNTPKPRATNRTFLQYEKTRRSGIALGIMFFVFFLIYFSARFPCYLQHFGAGSCRFNCLCNILELEPFIFLRFCNILVQSVTFWSWKLPSQGYLQFEPLILNGICSILVLEPFM